MSDLTGFLLARIAEDETAARHCADKADLAWEYEPRLGQVWTVYNDPDRTVHMPALRSPLGHHIARHDPVRVLAECEAKRRIVSEATILEGTDRSSSARRLLHALAAIYADHPDYDEAWRP